MSARAWRQSDRGLPPTGATRRWALLALAAALLSGCPPVEPPIPDEPADAGGAPPDAGRPPFDFEPEASENVEACERYRDALAGLPCTPAGTAIDCAPFASLGCDLSGFFTCAASDAACVDGALDSGAIAACGAPASCSRDNRSSVAACHAWRAVQGALGCEGGFSRAACEELAASRCDAAPFFRCLAERASCEDEGGLSASLEACASEGGCIPPAVSTVLACEEWQRQLASLPCIAADEPPLDCSVHLAEGCDRSAYFGCLAVGYSCEGDELVPDVEQCAPLGRCELGAGEAACRDWARAANACAPGALDPVACSGVDEALCDVTPYFRCLERAAICAEGGVLVDHAACAEQTTCPAGMRAFEGCAVLAGRAAELGCVRAAADLCVHAVDRFCDASEAYACYAERALCDEAGLSFDEGASAACDIGECAEIGQGNVDACEAFRQAQAGCATEPLPLPEGTCEGVRSAPCDLRAYFACHVETALCGDAGLVVDRQACADTAACTGGLEALQACRDKNQAVAGLGCVTSGEDEEDCAWVVGEPCRFEAYYDCMASAYYCGVGGSVALDPQALELCDALFIEACEP